MNFNPDNIKIERYKPILENNALLNKLHEKTDKKLDSYRPNFENFRSIYGNEEVDGDIRYVEELEDTFEKNLSTEENAEFLRKEKKISDIVESILTDQLSGSWLNSNNPEAPYNVVCYPTSKFDDYRNGADMVLEVLNNQKEDSSHLGLSLDVTFSNNDKNLDKKMNRIIDEIKNNWKPEIKYFESDMTDYIGKVDIARSVIVISRNTVEDLFKKELNSLRDELENHPVQISLLAQVEEQAETFLALCEKHSNETMAKIYREVLQNIKYIKSEKRDTFSEIEEDENTLREKHEGLKLLHRSLVRSLV